MLGLALTIIFGALAIHFGYLVREHGWREGFRQWRSSNSPLFAAFGTATAKALDAWARMPEGGISSGQGRRDVYGKHRSEDVYRPSWDDGTVNPHDGSAIDPSERWFHGR